MRKYALLLCVLTLPLFALSVSAQTDTIVAGALGDSSIVAPVVSWNRAWPHGNNFTLSMSGWTVAGEFRFRRAVTSLSTTPINAYSGDRIYVDGEHADDLEFDASSLEATFGRIDPIGKHWTSDVRLVALHDQFVRLNKTYAGLRTRQAWWHITAEDPLLRTFEGFEVAAMAEVFAGDEAWGRIRLDQRFSRRWGRVRFGESIFALQGHELDVVHAFLVGGYGYRYAEFRIDRGVGADVDLGFAISRAIELGAHAGAMRSGDLDTRGAAVDITALIRGIGVRLGVGKAQDRDEIVVYGSILAARFIR